MESVHSESHLELGVVLHTYNPMLGRLKQENGEFKANLGYIVTPSPCPNEKRS